MMQQTIVICILLLANHSFTFAQNYDHIWLFGYSLADNVQDSTFGISVLDFRNPSFAVDSYYVGEITMDFQGSNVCISNEEGEILFYSNAIFVANQEHQIMENGGDLNEWNQHGYGLPQGVLALPYPISNSYVLTNSDYFDHFALIHGEERIIDIDGGGIDRVNHKMLYSEIDMTTNGGLGELTIKNNLLLDEPLQLGMFTACRHANGRDWWIIVFKNNSNVYYRFLLDPNGIHQLDVATVDLPITSGLGQAVFSPDGNYYAQFNAISLVDGQYIDIFHFDRCTGYLSEQTQIHYIEDVYSGGIAIAPNSRYLYVSSYTNIYQYDLWAEDIANTQIKVAEYDGFADPFATRFYLAQLAPDGKIYINSPNGVRYLHVIRFPDKKGIECFVHQHGLKLPTPSITMPNYPNYRLGALEDSPCDSLVSVRHIAEKVDVKIFPNPTSHQLNIVLHKALEGKVELTLTNLLGQELFTQQIADSQTRLSIDVKDFKDGIYLCQIKNEQAILYSERVLVVK